MKLKSECWVGEGQEERREIESKGILEVIASLT